MPSAVAALRSHPDVRDVARLAAPAVAHSLLQTLVFLVDRVMLGHHSATALAAMQTAGPLVWSTYSVFSAFTVGTGAVVGRAVGAGATREAGAALRGSLALAVALGALLAVLGTTLLDPLLDAFYRGGDDAAVRAVTRAYLRVVFPAMPALFVGLTTIAALQAAGNTRTPFVIAIATNAVNIAGNWVLIFGHLGAPRLGATGAAWSHAAALTLEAVLGLWALGARGSAVPLRAPRGGAREDGPTARASVARVLAVSWGAWAERLAYHTGYLLFVRFIVGLGAAAMAANQAVISIESIAFLTADGCAVAAGSLVAQRLGAGAPERARQSGWIAAALCATILAGCAVLFAAVPAALVRAFRADAAIIAAGVPALRVAALAQVPMAISVVLAQALRGAGATREALAITFLGALAVRLAATYLAVRVLGLGLAGVWLGSTCDWVTRACVCIWRWRAGAWQNARV